MLGRIRSRLADKWSSSPFRIIHSRLTKPAPDSAETRHGGNIVASVLKENNVDNIFVLSGGHVSPIFTGCEKEGIKVVDLRNEASAVFAADAAARLTGGVGVAVVTAGPGVTNTVTAVKNAQMAGSPLVVIGGAAATMLKARGALQDIPQRPIMEPVCKATFTVNAVRDIVPTLKEALTTAQEGTPGPVFVEMPIDTLYPYENVRADVIGGGAPNKVVSFYLESYLHNMFSGAFDVTDMRVEKHGFTVDKQKVEEVQQLLNEAKRPVILLQSQATLQPEKLEKLAQKLENAGVPVFLGGMARGLLGSNSAVQCRHARGKALKDADLVILGGVSADFRLNYGRSLPRKAKIVTINRDKAELTKNTDLFWKPSVSVHTDAADFLLELLPRVNPERYSPWLSERKAADEARDAEITTKAGAPAGGQVNPLALFQQLDQVLPEDAILIADGGDFVATASYILKPRSPLSWLDPGPYGTLGVGGGFAVGAATIYPDRPIYVIYGDGSAGYSVVEMDTMKRHGLDNVKVIVGNDGAWTQILRAQKELLGSDVANILSQSAYEQIAHAFECTGSQLVRPDQLTESLGELNASSVPTLVNVHIGTTDFREGSISV